uniref:NADH dehydrogenase [ubiquinone] 1 beta subcomplex subunit 9 n=1 Tax=Bos taurus TaxID=9913 RepID=A0AAA9RXK2_BOVIN
MSGKAVKGILEAQILYIWDDCKSSAYFSLLGSRMAGFKAVGDKYRYFACLLRARFDEHKNEKDMVKATQLLREAEEEFWHGQHPQPYIFPESPGGTSYERYECYKVPEWCLDDWHPSEKAMYPDYFAKREQWKKLRRESWEREVKQLQEETPVGGPRTEALPPARKQGDLPPLWWHIVTRPRERPM